MQLGDPASSGSVRVPSAMWQLDEASELGAFRTYSSSRKWCINASRQQSLLTVTRVQRQLAPAFAATAHVSQGQTLSAAMPDLAEGNGVGLAAAYVALTRVRLREDPSSTCVFRRRSGQEM